MFRDFLKSRVKVAVLLCHLGDSHFLFKTIKIYRLTGLFKFLNNLIRYF